MYKNDLLEEINSNANFENEELREVLNIGAGSSTATIEELIGSHVKMGIPKLKILDSKSINKDMTFDPASYGIKMSFCGGFSGQAAVLISDSMVLNLTEVVNVPIKSAEEITNKDKEDVLYEIGNILVNSLLVEIANLVSKRLNYTVPKIAKANQNDIIDTLKREEIEKVILVDTKMTISKHNIDFKLLLLFTENQFFQLKIFLMNSLLLKNFQFYQQVLHHQ